MGRQWGGGALGPNSGGKGSAGENVCLLFSAGLRVELTGTVEDDEQHHFGRQWGVHVGLSQGGRVVQAKICLLFSAETAR